MSDALEIAETMVVVRGQLEKKGKLTLLKLIFVTKGGDTKWHAIEATYVWENRLWQLRGGLANCHSEITNIENWYTRGMGKLYQMVTTHEGQCHICMGDQSAQPIDPTHPVIMPVLCAIHAEAKQVFFHRDRDFLLKRLGGYIGELMQTIRAREGFA